MTTPVCVSHVSHHPLLWSPMHLHCRAKCLVTRAAAGYGGLVRLRWREGFLIYNSSGGQKKNKAKTINKQPILSSSCMSHEHVSVHTSVLGYFSVTFHGLYLMYFIFGQLNMTTNMKKEIHILSRSWILSVQMCKDLEMFEFEETTEILKVQCVIF